MTYFPSLYTGVGMHCTNIPPESLGSQLLGDAKVLMKVLKIISKLPY